MTDDVDTLMNTSLLLIEDNDLDVEFIRRVMRKLSLDLPVIRARDGEEALALLRPMESTRLIEAPFAVLLDLNMPRISGLELLRMLQNEPGLENVPIYILTTSSSTSDQDAARELGADGYIVKPIEPDELVEVLRAAT